MATLTELSKKVGAWKPQGKTVTGIRALDDELVRKTLTLDSGSSTGERTNRVPKYGDAVTKTTYLRTPMVITCERWLALPNPKYIAFTVNPSSVSFNFSRRGSTQKTHGGSIRHAAPRRRWDTSGQYDEFTVDITFQSGMIIPVLIPKFIGNTKATALSFTNPNVPPFKYEISNNDTISKGGSSNIPAGLNALHMLMELLDENVVYKGRPNNHIVFYSSKKFPSLAMKGFFSNDGPNFSDEAGEPASFTYSLQFEAWISQPDPRKGSDMMKAYETFSPDLKNY